MIESGSVLGKVCNVEKLNMDIQNRMNRYVVYNY